ncbi:MAG: hypothetical protein NZZ60_00765 [Bacteroidia bacterium]|nr:hypothetical protein [Bacteroidia bacterium]MCX7651738.1 hypothetical protein [Bacteroidia bacterium]MDW8417382.1 hypothetical protein [Bacteroidia bacterium]
MEFEWVEGQVWIKSDFYEGPHDILLLFAQRAQIRWEDLSLEELLSAAVNLLPSLPLEERIGLLLFLSHLLRIKAFSLLPNRQLLEESAEPSSTSSQGLALGPRLWESISESWANLIRQSHYRLPRPSEVPASVEAEPVITGLSLMRLYRAYEETVRRYHRRHVVHRLTPPPFSPEEVEEHLMRLFEDKPRVLLSHLWTELLPHPIYRAMAFLLILFWIQEGHLAVNAESPWAVELSWQR